MKTRITLSLLLILLWGLNATAGPRPTVGMHKLQIAEPGVRSRLVSIPFLRIAEAYGRLDGVSHASGGSNLPELLDEEAAFAAVSNEGTYILRITSGPYSGNWFILDASDADGKRVSVREDGLGGSVVSLSGDEAFAIHKLFALKELFPEANSSFPTAPIDLAAMQVHFYDGNRFSKCWLSDGTLTGHVGWTLAEDGHLKAAGDLAILPGTSFLVVFPNAIEAQSIQINGVVPYSGLSVPVYPGYNYVSVKYTQALDGGLAQAAGYLNSLGLKESGFSGGVDAESSDLILALNDASGRFVEGYYYDTSAGDFKAASEESVGITLDEVGPGRGFVILNRGEPYLWNFNQ